jgi:hypothetical protein
VGRRGGTGPARRAGQDSPGKRPRKHPVPVETILHGLLYVLFLQHLLFELNFPIRQQRIMMDSIHNFASIIAPRNPTRFGRLGTMKTIAKVILMTMIASTVVACATPPAKAPVVRKG